MKAAFFMRHGGPEVLQYGDVPDPVAGPGELLVDVHAASVNAADWKMRAGSYTPVSRFPYVLGRDFSGVVAAPGEGVSEFKAGDPVFGVCDVGQEGAYAEKLAIKAAIVASKPDALPHAQCAALALAGLTALVSIEDTLQLARGETILIQGGAGGVAGFAIQLAKHIGARVVTTASAANHAYVLGLGADEVIDYRDRGLHAQSVGLRCGLRHGRRRSRIEVVRGVATRGARRVHRFRRVGSSLTTDGRSGIPAAGRTRPTASRAPHRTRAIGRRAASGDRALSSIGCCRGPHDERRPSLSREARIRRALADRPHPLPHGEKGVSSWFVRRDPSPPEAARSRAMRASAVASHQAGPLLRAPTRPLPHGEKGSALLFTAAAAS